MCYGEDQDAVRVWSVDYGKRKVPDHNAPKVGLQGRTREREAQSAGDRFLDRGAETRSLL